MRGQVNLNKMEWNKSYLRKIEQLKSRSGMVPFYCRLPHNILSCACAPNQSIAGNQFYWCGCAVTQFCFVCFFRSFPIISVTVSEEGIAKAGKAIKEVQEKLLPQCTRRFKANFLIGKADYFIRRATRPGGDIGEQERDLRTGNNHLVSEKCRKNERSCDTSTIHAPFAYEQNKSVKS